MLWLAMRRPTAWMVWMRLAATLGVAGAVGCGETARVPLAESSGATGQGGSAGEGGSGGGEASGNTGTGGNYGQRHCPAETKVEAPAASSSCAVSPRNVDPMFTCGEADCAVKKALDLNCGSLPGAPWLSATDEGAALLAVTHTENNAEALARLVTVSAVGARVDDVPELADPSLPLPAFSILNAAMATDASGASWLFAGAAAPITSLRDTDAGWMRSHLLPTVTPLATAQLTDVRVVNDSLAYLTYTDGSDAYAPHLVTWDGSCWTDETLEGRSSPTGLTVAVDEERQPWAAWFYESLYLRNPSGDTEDILASLDTGSELFTNVSPPLRLQPGGPNASSPAPLVAARVQGGLALFSKSGEAQPRWRSTLLPESNTITTNCPFGNEMPASGADPCAGVTSCNAEGNATSSGFGLARTGSGSTFAAWVVYSSEGTYALEKSCSRGELPYCFCTVTDGRGTGTADLVVMRLTESEPVLAHFRFDMAAPTVSANRDAVMTARGDTLLVAAQLGGINVPTLTYLEIDSTQLP